MFGSPPSFPCNKLKYVHEAEITNCSLKSLQVLQQARRAIHQTIQGTMPLSLSKHAHKFQSYNPMWVKRILTQSLEPLWKSSYPVVPSTPTQCHPMNPPCLAKGGYRKPRQMGHTRSSDLLRLRLTDMAPMTMVVLFCLLCLHIEKAHKPHKPRPWV